MTTLEKRDGVGRDVERKRRVRRSRVGVSVSES